MREKEQRIIVTFPTTDDAMAMEFFCKENEIEGRLIPLPSIISAECGVCWSSPIDLQNTLEEAVKDKSLNVSGFYAMFI